MGNGDLFFQMSEFLISDAFVFSGTGIRQAGVS